MQRENVQSSNIKSIGYNPVRRKLEIEFKSGDVYRYKSVPKTVHKQMMASKSKGSFLHHHIKFQYPYRKYQSGDGDFAKGEWKTLSKPVRKTAFDEMFDEYLEKLARTKLTEDQAKLALKKLDIDVSKEKWALSDFLDGMNVELEHGTIKSATNITDDDLIMTAKIALAHLNEFPTYYKALDKMEKSLKKNSFELGFNACLEKLAALNSDVELYPHQKRVVDSPETSKIIAHSVGGGKTLTAIAKFEKMKQDGKATHALVIVPAGLRENFHEKGVQRFTNSKSNIVGTKQEQKSKLYGDINPDADYNIMSYEMYRKDPARAIMMAKADTVISDEAHKGKNEGTLTTEQLKKYRPLYKNHISLTGSLVSNSVSDVQPLLEVVSNRKANVGKSKDEFERMYVRRDNSKKYQDVKEKRRPIVGFKNPHVLGPELTRYIDYADYDDLKHVADMPDKKVSVKKVPISKQQAKMYKQMLKDDPAMMKLIKEKRLETLKSEEIASAFNKLIEERKLMNSVGSVVPGISLSESSEITPKTKALLDSVDNHLKTTPDGEVILMSHLINGGTDVLEQGLKDRHIQYGTFLGKGNKGVTEATRQQAVRDYNDHKKRVMIISDAGGEGLSLNDTTYEAVLDPHFNPERMKQMEARGIRSGGLKGRADRTVQVDRYLATMPKTLGIFKSNIKTPDEFIYELQANKEDQNQKLYQLLRQYE